MSTPPTLLCCRELSRRFGGLLAIDRLSFNLAEGEILGLIGPNGSGKTTFFNVLTGIYPASGGSVEFAGATVTGLRPQKIYRAGISRTFQRSRLCLPLSVFDNIMIGNHLRLDHGPWLNLLHRSALRQQVAQNFEEARELIRIFNRPLADRMLEAVAGISLIDRRRIEICRAMISRPRLLLLDEPSAGMTREETSRLMDDILEVKRRFGRLTIVLIEHEMSVIERCTDRCVVLDYGKKLAEGTYAQVAENPLVRQAYLGIS
ncbi:MAG TPA: ABC transporter ATP-binding protein [Myxococcaceae bacterium]|nr:ABC transporter ATP-binding protein [Myxococcaceae bacterium]